MNRIHQMTAEEIEGAKRAAKSMYPEIDYSKTYIHIMPKLAEDVEMTASRPIKLVDGYALCYFEEIDRLFVGMESELEKHPLWTEETEEEGYITIKRSDPQLG